MIDIDNDTIKKKTEDQTNVDKAPLIQTPPTPSLPTQAPPTPTPPTPPTPTLKTKESEANIAKYNEAKMEIEEDLRLAKVEIVEIKNMLGNMREVNQKQSQNHA